MGRGRVENLIKMQEVSPEEARKMGQAGGIKSGIARKRSKTMREALKMLLQMETLDEARAEALRDLGVDPSYLHSIQLSMLGTAERGDVEAARYVRDTSGEKPAQAVDMAITDKPFEALELKALSDQDLAALADGCGADVVSGETKEP